MTYSEKSFLSLNSRGYHRIVYNDWGDKNARPVIGVHGLTGNGHDFDYLAEDLIKHGFRLIAVDLPGRGRSDFLPDPMDYNYTQYCHDLMALLAHLDLARPSSVDWLGISLGGLLGITLAGMKDSPIARMILNDVGPEVPKAALDFIHMVIAQQYTFGTIEEIELRMRQTRGLIWGPISDEQWHHMAAHNVRALDDGTLTYGYDPAIAKIFESEPTGDSDLWPYWDAITAPVQVIHGAQSMVLTSAIIDQMRESYTGTSFDLVQFADCGHVPSLMHPHQIEIVRKWLEATPF